jgi:hypothetical protein
VYVIGPKGRAKSTPFPGSVQIHARVEGLAGSSHTTLRGLDVGTFKAGFACPQIIFAGVSVLVVLIPVVVFVMVRVVDVIACAKSETVEKTSIASVNRSL